LAETGHAQTTLPGLEISNLGWLYFNVAIYRQLLGLEKEISSFTSSWPTALPGTAFHEN